MKYKFTWDTEGVRIRFHGLIGTKDILAAKAEFHGDSRFESQKYSIWDFSNCTPGMINPSQFNSIVAYHIGASFTLPTHKLALVSKSIIVRKLLEKFISESKATGSPWEFAIFKAEEEALEWGMS